MKYEDCHTGSDIHDHAFHIEQEILKIIRYVIPGKVALAFMRVSTTFDLSIWNNIKTGVTWPCG